MRSNLYLDPADSEFSWKRISHIDRSNRPGWEEMAGLWKARAEWINEEGLESDAEDYSLGNGIALKDGTGAVSMPSDTQSLRKTTHSKRLEKLVVGWGGSIWIIDVYAGGPGVGKEIGERKAGRVEVVTM